MSDDLQGFSALPTGQADAICMDVPWRFKTFDGKATNRSTERHYPTMTLDQIAALPVASLAAPDCHLFFWTTGPFLQKAFAIINGYGFRYSSMAFVWIKLRRAYDVTQLTALPTIEADFHLGTGHTTRKNAEFCILARRGSPKRHAKDVRELIVAPVREHSRKPEEFRDRVDRYVGRDQGRAPTVIELFARSQRPGWISWGNEINRFR